MSKIIVCVCVSLMEVQYNRNIQNSLIWDISKRYNKTQVTLEFSVYQLNHEAHLEHMLNNPQHQPQMNCISKLLIPSKNSVEMYEPQSWSHTHTHVCGVHMLLH